MFALPNGVTAPTVPSSYREVSMDSFYDFDPYSAQPLDYARTYEVVQLSAEFGEWWWRTIVAGVSRGDYWGFAEKSLVIAESEIVNDSRNQDMAGFNNVQYRGNYSYMLFDQDNRFAQAPFSLIWYYPYKYSTHANGL